MYLLITSGRPSCSMGTRVLRSIPWGAVSLSLSLLINKSTVGKALFKASGIPREVPILLKSIPEAEN